MSRNMNLVLLFVCLLFGFALTPAQDQTKRTYTKADFINIDGGNLNERVERAFKQFKSSNQGDSVWIAYHFPAREGSSIGPFSGMIYYDDGIKLERRDDPSSAAIFLLTDATGSQPKFIKVKTLSLSEQFVFENRPVYWLGNIDASQSINLLEGTLRADKENKELARGAIRAISVHNSPRVIPFLKEIAVKESNVDVQRSAISNLSRLKTPESVDALIHLYDTSNADLLKEEIISGLARDDSRKATDKLLAIAKNDSNPKMRQHAIRRLSSHRRSGIWIN
jgi:hypothetical protein